MEQERELELEQEREQEREQGKEREQEQEPEQEPERERELELELEQELELEREREQELDTMKTHTLLIMALLTACTWGDYEHRTWGEHVDEISLAWCSHLDRCDKLTSETVEQCIDLNISRLCTLLDCEFVVDGRLEEYAYDCVAEMEQLACLAEFPVPCSHLLIEIKR